VLWMARCSLQDLGGVSSLPVLEELYFSFNDVHELSPLYAHDVLQVIDLEGNLVNDFEEIKSLETLPSLRELTLNSNPVTQSKIFSRQAVLEAIPQLEMLDDLPARDGGNSNAADDLTLSSDSDIEGGHATGADTENLVFEDTQQDKFGTAFPVVTDLVQGRALQELRQRCQTPDVGQVRPVAESGVYSAAVAELHARRAELDGIVNQENLQPRPGCETEPSDQDLIVEGLKRAPKPAPSLLTQRSPNDGSLHGGGFSPDVRQCHKRACSSSVSSSTAYRPTTASSCTTRDDASVATASELTTGDDGSSLAGNPLEVIRRRRRSTASGANAAAADFGIRNLMRRFGDASVSEPRDAAAAVGQRLATPDVRIGAGRPTTPAGLLAQFEKKKHRLSTSASCASLPGAGPLCEMAPRFSASGRKGGYALSGTPPTFATGDGEVLLLE